MRVEALNNSTGSYRMNTYGTTVPKRTVTSYPKFNITKEADNTGKGMKQLSYIIGMSILGISSIIIGAKGKPYNAIKI